MTTAFLILLIDDDPDMLMLLSQTASSIFERAQFIAVHSFEQAAAYLEGLRGAGPQLILLDINLQGERNGLDFLSLLQQHPQGRLIPTIILSADDNPAVSQEAYERGANAYTLKPDTYAGWQAYVEQLRTYWFDMVSLPRLSFENEATPKAAG